MTLFQCLGARHTCLGARHTAAQPHSSLRGGAGCPKLSLIQTEVSHVPAQHLSGYCYSSVQQTHVKSSKISSTQGRWWSARHWWSYWNGQFTGSLVKKKLGLQVSQSKTCLADWSFWHSWDKDNKPHQRSLAESIKWVCMKEEPVWSNEVVN